MRTHLDSGFGRAAGAVLLTVVLAGCGSNVTTPAPTGTPTVAPPTTPATAAPTPVPTDAGTSPAPTQPSQTDTEWGRIWDALPGAFPSFPGASPTETGEGPASATLDAGAAEPAEVSGYYQDALESAGFTISGSGPFEDGSFQVEATAQPAGCAVRITIAPLGGATLITILYGASCPFS